MIKQIRLKDYILIEELVATFDEKLNVITGETGAGKSILINAIDLAFAPRVSKEVIKTGKEKAIIELIIENKNHNLKNFFEENGIDDLGSEIIISKEISQNSVRSKVNGSLVNTDILKYLRSIFVDIHSQHQTYSYMQPKFHINLLDSYGKNCYGNKLQDYKNMYSTYLDLQNQLTNAKNNLNTTENQIEFLKFQIDEIQGAEIKSPTEDEDLTNELNILENAEKLKELTGSSYWSLNGDDSSIIEGLRQIKQSLSKASSLDNNLTQFDNNLLDAIEILRDIASNLNSYSQNLENDTERLNEIQERLFLLDKLKHKYGNTLENVLETLNNLSSELESINSSNENVCELELKISQIQNELTKIAKEISQHRKDFAQILSSQIQDKLTFLELPKSKFEIRITSKELSQDGIDNVEFMISTNISEDLKPLNKVASGGEISRVMLAIKSIFAENDNIDTVIFDEIDTGISGKASQSVAEEIEKLSKYHQIVLITHQAIIAAKSDKHFYVKKSQTDKTNVDVYVLKDDNKIKALAELAGGEINQQSMEFAQSLLKN